MSESAAIPFRSGFVSIIGRPNVGKSTLLNRILGEKIVITSEKPQTTRNRIHGIHSLPDAQIVFIDTPGIHEARSPLNRYMVDTAIASLKGADAVLFLVEATSPAGTRESLILENLKDVEVPVFLVINKIDLVAKESLLPLIDSYSRVRPFHAVIPLSAGTGNGVERLVKAVQDILPEGPRYFPDDILSDVPERFIVAEMVREKVFRLTHDEIPYSVAVVVDSFKEREDGSLISISATINVERDSQKGIIIGRKGEMLKRIGSQARLDIERLVGTKVFLELFVRVSRQWTEDKRMLREFGYEKE